MIAQLRFLRYLFFAQTVLIWFLGAGEVRAQYGIDRQIQFANEEQDKSMLRIDRSKADVDDTIKRVAREIEKLTAPIVDAQYNCKIRSPGLDIIGGVENRLNFLKSFTEDKNKDIEIIKKSAEVKLRIAKQSVERLCYPGSESRLDSYLSCLTARERYLHILNVDYGIERLKIIHKIDIMDAVNNYSLCASNEGAIRESDILAAGRAAAGGGEFIKVMADKMNEAAARYLAAGNR